MKERDIWDEAIRSKLKNYEADTDSAEWEVIEERLHGKKNAVFLHLWRYAAVAVVFIGYLMGGLYFFNKTENPQDANVAVLNTEKHNFNKNDMQSEEIPAIKAEASDGNQMSEEIVSHEGAKGETVALARTPDVRRPGLILKKLSHQTTNLGVNKVNHVLVGEENRQLRTTLDEQFRKYDLTDFIAQAETPLIEMKNKPMRRLHFGMGGGSFSANTNGGGAGGNFMTDGLTGNLGSPNKENQIYTGSLTSIQTNVERQNVKHHSPLSLGVGVGYSLDDRWSLYSGLSYSILRSEWTTHLSHPDKYKQNLHFVGIPLGVSYRIAEWKKFHWYASASGMAEWNVYGNVKVKSNSSTSLSTFSAEESIRMKPLQWSLNAHTGVSYPLLRFLSAYVEGGANYYFDNGSSIETIRSDKPFNLSLQAGVRFGL